MAAVASSVQANGDLVVAPEFQEPVLVAGDDAPPRLTRANSTDEGGRVQPPEDLKEEVVRQL